MKKILLALSASFALLQLQAAEAEWQTDLPKAQAQATKEKKMVLLDFTGSDWCGWCIKLHKEVFVAAGVRRVRKRQSGAGGGGFPERKKLSAGTKAGERRARQEIQDRGLSDHHRA